MKKYVSIILVLVMLLSVFYAVPLTAHAELSGSCGNSIKWTLSDDYVLTISGTGQMKNYSSGQSVPWRNRRITSVVIGNGVTSIGDYAFYETASLAKVTIPDSVESIGKEAFSYCKHLVNIIIPGTVTCLGDNAFSYCTSLESVTIPTSVTSVGTGCFSGCSALSSADISNSVLSISNSMFSRCTSLTCVEIPCSVTSIGDYAFYGCNSLTAITLPNSVISIGSCSLYSCTSLNGVSIPDSVTSIGWNAFHNCTALQSICIPNSVKTISQFAFSNCTSLTSVKISDSLKTISANLFSGCTSLASIAIPDSVSDIESNAFDKCTKLEEITFGKSVKTIGNNSFSECSSLKNVSLPDSLVSIGKQAFTVCRSLTSIMIPNSLKTIEEEAFYNCYSLTNVYVGTAVESIGIRAFSGCSSLDSIMVDTNNPVYDSRNNCNAVVHTASNTLIVGCRASFVPDTVSIIGKYAYCRTPILSVAFPDSVIRIESHAFEDCYSLTNISIGQSVKSIGEYAFYNCRTLQNIIISDSVTDIGDFAFSSCIKLTDIIIGDSVTNIGNGVLAKDKSLKSIIIPDSVISVGDGVFSDCENVSSITIGNSVRTIGEYAFSNCSSLKNISFGNSVTYIGEWAFNYCTSLESVTFPDSLTVIERAMFYECRSLKRVVIGNSVTRINNGAFLWCGALTDVVFGDSVNYIDNDVFALCRSLVSITIPETVTYIGGQAFECCSSLTQVTIPISITNINGSVFDECEKLKDVYYTGTEQQWNMITIGNNNDYLLSANKHFNQSGPDMNTRLGFGKLSGTNTAYDCVIGEDAKVTVVLKSNKYSISNLDFSIADQSVVSIKGLRIGAGDYLTTGKEKKAEVYLEPKKAGSTKLTVTAPNGTTAACAIIVETKQNSEQATAIANQISNVDMGPYAINGATIDVAGYEIPLIKLESTIKMDLGNLKIINDGANGTIQVLLGFDQKASANIDGAQNSTTYWSESYKEVKNMYQSLTGKKVDTTRLWNKYSSLRGKLKKNNANMVINVNSDLTGYVEFKKVGNSYVFSEGGIMASFSANTSLRSYYGPAYVALGLGVNAKGSLVFVYENNKVNPQINVNPSFTVSAGAGIGTRKTYAEIDAYGTLGAEISSAADNPFTAYLDLGVKWSGYIIGKEIFSGSKSFVKAQLYPNFGEDLRFKAIASTGAEFSDMDYYSAMLNSSHTISREYLNQCNMSNRQTIAATGSSPDSSSFGFEKTYAYPLSEPSLVNFDDGTALLVWIDDSGEKTDNNMCSLYYSFFNGAAWSAPTELFENGTANDMPSVYSDGTYAYIVWQRADQVFSDDISVTDMMNHFDLYETTFDSSNQSFTTPIRINSLSNTAFEFNPQICGSDGSFIVSWIENSNNNIMQMSGNNTLKAAEYNATSEMTGSQTITVTDSIISKTVQTIDGIYYCVQTDEGTELFSCIDNTITKFDEVQDFAIADGKLFYLKDGMVCISSEGQEYEYANLSGLNNFSITSNGESMYLFTLVLNEDFTKSLYYSVYDYDSGSWSALECYHEGNSYIRNYSPAIVGDEIFVAYNLVSNSSETGYQQASLVVDGKTSCIDIQLNYIDFSDENIGNDSIALNYEVQNNSSQTITGIQYFIMDENDVIIDSGVATCNLGAFETTTGSIVTDKLNGLAGKQFSVKILPNEYTDYNLSNNLVSSTFEVIPDYEEEVYILGDADGDGDITILDATVIQRYLASFAVQKPEYVEKCGDVNGDGIDIIDATCIQRYLASFTVPYEIGKPISA